MLEPKVLMVHHTFGSSGGRQSKGGQITEWSTCLMGWSPE